MLPGGCTRRGARQRPSADREGSSPTRPAVRSRGSTACRRRTRSTCRRRRRRTGEGWRPAAGQRARCARGRGHAQDLELGGLQLKSTRARAPRRDPDRCPRSVTGCPRSLPPASARGRLRVVRVVLFLAAHPGCRRSARPMGRRGAPRRSVELDLACDDAVASFAREGSIGHPKRVAAEAIGEPRGSDEDRRGTELARATRPPAARERSRRSAAAQPQSARAALGIARTAS